MMEKEKDLFGELPRHKRQLSPFHPGRLTFTLSYENIAFCGIALVIAFVVSFALGVEKGRRSAVLVLPSVNEIQQKPLNEIQSKIRPSVQDSKSISEVAKMPSPAISENYTIQLVTYTSANMARQIGEELKAKGYSPFVIVSGKYYQVCNGSYVSRSEAEKNLPVFKKTYKDSFVRKFKKQ